MNLPSADYKGHDEPGPAVGFVTDDFICAD